MKLDDVFIRLCNRYSGDSNGIESYWIEISEAYSHKKRFYHNLEHLQSMFTQLESCRDNISDWDAILFALFYHDLIYSATAKDNEEKSAVEAGKVLSKLNVPAEKIAFVKELILATRAHQQNEHNDINLFTDADLSILGSSSDEYEIYCANVRKEYSIYPDLLYKPGRRKVLAHFLNMPHIFKTSYFRERLESAARRNISQELTTL
jgi:predicted metal-dependent HD superfamily phosphohydrolase